MSAAMLILPFLLPQTTGETLAQTPLFFMTLVLFWVTAFASATHDIAADGFYMLGLDSGTQAEFVGIRSTFYRLSSIFGQGVLVALAGHLDTRTGDVHLAWKITLLVSAVIFAGVTLYHTWSIPKPSSDKMSSARTARDIFNEFGRTFATFFQKKYVLTALLFMLLYRLPEAFLVKMMNPFLLDSLSDGGLGLSTESVGIIYGTIGVAALTAGGILGGITTGMPVIFRTSIKPTPSIAAPQNSVSLSKKESCSLTIQGRHDPCIVPRAVPVVEAAAAIAIFDLILGNTQTTRRK